MMLKYAGAAVLGLALLPAPGSSQTAAELMQKAVYAQQTTGDLKQAIQLYRQILTSSGADRKTAAAAQFRLAQALLQNGDLSEAAREFQMLANYPEYKDAIAALAGRAREPRHTAISHGRLAMSQGQPSVYTNQETGVRVTAPAGWPVADSDSSDNGIMAIVVEQETQAGISIWMRSEQHAAAEIPGLLRQDIENKYTQRMEGWKVRPESIQTTTINGSQAIGGIADFTVNGHTFVEYVTWIRTPKSHVFVFAAAPSNDQTFQQRYAQVLNTVVVP